MSPARPPEKKDLAYIPSRRGCLPLVRHWAPTIDYNAAGIQSSSPCMNLFWRCPRLIWLQSHCRLIVHRLLILTQMLAANTYLYPKQKNNKRTNAPERTFVQHNAFLKKKINPEKTVSIIYRITFNCFFLEKITLVLLYFY